VNSQEKCFRRKVQLQPVKGNQQQTTEYQHTFTRQTNVGKLKLICVNDTTTCRQTFGGKYNLSLFPPTFRQQFASVHTHQLEFANTSWPT